MELVTGVGPGSGQATMLPEHLDEARARLREVADQVTPMTLAGDRRIEVLPSLGRLLPDGLQRGTTVGVRGPGSVSLGLAVVAGPVASGSWAAMIGCGDLCLAGAEQLGLALHRTVLVDQPPRSSWGAVVAALVDAFDVVMVSGSYRARSQDARKLSSRARERGSVIVDIGGIWPEVPDIVLEVCGQVWLGLGRGHGALSARQVRVKVSGRRGVGPCEASLWLPGADAAPAAVDDSAHSGADVDALVQVSVEADTGVRSGTEHHLEAV